MNTANQNTPTSCLGRSNSALTDTAIRNAKPRDNAYKLSDGGGLFLLVQPTGGKLWSLKFRTLGKEKSLSFGSYPSVGLKDARKKRDSAKEQLAAGTDPAHEKMLGKIAARTSAGNTFQAVAEEFVAAKMAANGRADVTVGKATWIGHSPNARFVVMITQVRW